jgi:hypothetical protein
MLEGALILLAGILIGIGIGVRVAARRDGPNPVTAVCGCTHHYSMHDPKTGACVATVPVDKYAQNGEQIGKELVPCACVRYVGPEPLPTYIATEIATQESP